MAKKVTPKNLEQVLMRLYLVAENDEDCMKVICRDLNDFLNVLSEDDFFGTEGQLDPRGDRRNDD